MAKTKPAFLVFDIETVVDGRLLQKVRYADESAMEPAQAVARQRQELLEKTGSDFIPHTFQLPVSVAIAKVGADHYLQDVVTLDAPNFRPQVITRQFWSGWEAYGQPALVTFNGRGFDVPVLEMAAFRYGIPIPGWMRFGAKSWDDPRNRFNSSAHIDVQEQLTNFGAARLNGGLNLCATLLGKPGKMGTQGQMVQDLWEAGEHQRIDDYCMCDALDTYFVFLRLRVLQGFLSIDDERERVNAAHAWIEAAAVQRPALQEYLQHFQFWQPIDDQAWPFLDPADQSSG
ncbi:MAG: 3'-5' exonuclease [Planctomycetota bacterium]|nr:MAG: 3'-5' exonuclease [Planctomycetota bacterium]